MLTAGGPWLLNFAGFLLMPLGFSSTLPAATGLLCGWRMRSLSVRRALSIGVVAGPVAFLLSVGAVLVTAPCLAMMMLPISPAIA